MGVVGLAFSTYLGRAFPAIPVRVSASAVILLITGFNIFGIDFTSRVIIGLLGVTVALLALFSAVALPAVNPARFVPVLGDRGAVGILAGAAIFFWSWDGFMRAAIMASEVKEPRRSIPIGIVGGTAIAAVVYLIVGGATLGVLGANELARQDTPLLAAAKQVAAWSFWPVLAAALVAIISDIFGVLLAASRVALAMSEAHEIPRWLAQVHEHFHTPYRSVVALGLASALLVLVFDLRSLIEVASGFMLVWYLVVHYAALQLPKGSRITSPIFSWYGIVGCLGLILFLPPFAALTAAGALALLSGVRWLVRRTMLRPGAA